MDASREVTLPSTRPSSSENIQTKPPNPAHTVEYVSPVEYAVNDFGSPIFCSKLQEVALQACVNLLRTTGEVPWNMLLPSLQEIGSTEDRTGLISMPTTLALK